MLCVWWWFLWLSVCLRSLFRCSTVFTLSVRPSWTQRLMKAAPVWTPLILGPPPSSRDPSDLHAHIACYPPSPPPPHRRPHSPIIKSPLHPLIGRCWEEERPPNAILHSLHHPDCTATTLLKAHCHNSWFVCHKCNIRDWYICSSSIFRAPVFPVWNRKLGMTSTGWYIFVKVLFSY